VKQSVSDSPTSPTSTPGPSRSGGLTHLFIALAILIVLRIVVGVVSFPIGSLRTMNVVVSVLFIAVPILGFYRGGSFKWTYRTAWLMVACGAASQLAFWAAQAPNEPPLAQGVFSSLSQTGLLLWTFGLGAALALFLRDKNLILPMSIFLALFDIWLVFAPEGIASHAASAPSSLAGQFLHNGGAFIVPAPAIRPQGGYAAPLAFVGPADWLFLAMFFVALYRFNMRTRATLYAMIPTLAAYLLIVLVFGNVELGPFRLGALPALLPIGTVILAVNWREFKLTKDEIYSTILILVLGIGVVTWRLIVSNRAQEQRPAPSNPVPDQGAPGFRDSHGQLYRV
jgi:hypothetical protein